MLNITIVEPELISDGNMYLFFQKGIIGSVSYILKRYNKGNNMHLKSYDPKRESKHIIYLNLNNLYGYVMAKFQQVDLNA